MNHYTVSRVTKDTPEVVIEWLRAACKETRAINAKEFNPDASYDIYMSNPAALAWVCYKEGEP